MVRLPLAGTASPGKMLLRSEARSRRPLDCSGSWPQEPLLPIPTLVSIIGLQLKGGGAVTADRKQMWLRAKRVMEG